MKADTQRQGFTLVVCSGCGTAPDGLAPRDVLATLRDAVRQCPHGMLVSVPCLFGGPGCADRPFAGPIAALQPCATDRTPLGGVRIVGPIRDLGDTTVLRAWVQAGRWNPGLLPSRLRNPFRTNAVHRSDRVQNQ